MAVTLKAKWVASCTIAEGTIYNFDYTGDEQMFTAPCDGYYKLEVWGASGGASYGSGRGGYGAYSQGVKLSSANNIIYVVVGGAGGDTCHPGFNGGNYGTHGGGCDAGGAGGGATHIALVSGLLSSLSSHATDGKIIIVAGAGGGESNSQHDGGEGGGMIGGVGYGSNGSSATGGSQTSGGTSTCNQLGSFGFGGAATNISAWAGYYGGGGGGGYYGGGGGCDTVSTSYSTAGGGGSGYIGSSNLISGGGITKHMTCYSCTASSDANTRTYSNANVSAIPTADYSKIGNGYARITFLGTSI